MNFPSGTVEHKNGVLSCQDSGRFFPQLLTRQGHAPGASLRANGQFCRQKTLRLVLGGVGAVDDVADELRANAWMIQQALAAGAHGILLCNAESPEAAKIMVEASRYPFAPVAPGLNQGFRGNGSQSYASKIWGLTPAEYLQRAEPWPLNPDGEIILGVKIENPRADANVESTVRVPGIAFAEWGPGDHGFYLVGNPATAGGRGDLAPNMVAVRKRVLDATKAAGIKFLNACNEANVIDQLKDGVMICTGGDSPAADKGRAYTKRTDAT